MNMPETQNCSIKVNVYILIPSLSKTFRGIRTQLKKNCVSHAHILSLLAQFFIELHDQPPTLPPYTSVYIGTIII